LINGWSAEKRDGGNGEKTSFSVLSSKNVDGYNGENREERRFERRGAIFVKSAV
jgi:hypothetical protein